MSPLLAQIKQRRLALKLKQHDMLLRVGISRQQYQKLETSGNPRLDTLQLVAKGLKSELLLIPEEKLQAVLDILQREKNTAVTYTVRENTPLADDPWQGLLDDTE